MSDNRPSGFNFSEPVKHFVKGFTSSGEIINENIRVMFGQKGGKGIMATYWIIMIIIIIYMFVLAIIYYNNYTKYTWNEDKQAWIYINNDGIEVIYEGPDDEFMKTMNIQKIVLNSLLIIEGLFVIICFCMIGYGVYNRNINGEAVPTFASFMIGFYIFICVIWFIVNIVWDATNISYINKKISKESFCGMMETFRGYAPESFVNKKLRKF